MTDTQRVNIGVVGCGPVAQFAHFDACRKASNAHLYAICDLAEDLVDRMAAIHQPDRTFLEYEEMLADPGLDAVIVATADAFHVPLARQALQAGKHVLVEKPLGTTVEECEALGRDVKAAGRVLQVGNNRRFDPGMTFAHQFIAEEMGEVVAMKAWYRDSTLRYTMTDNLQPIPIQSAGARRPALDPKADRKRYFMLTHGSHLVDTARFLAGELVAVRARLVQRFDAYCWFVDTELEEGRLGHLELTIPVRGDMEEGFHIWGEFGSAQGRSYLPWYHKSSEVECFSSRDEVYRRPLGADAYSYKLQIEGFADAILSGTPSLGATVDDGTAAIRALVAIARSVDNEGERVALDQASGAI